MPVLCVHPAVATSPPRTSTETTTLPGQRASAASSRSGSVNAAVPRIARSRASLQGPIDSLQAPKAPAVLHGHPKLCRDPAQVLEVARRSFPGPVEIDDVEMVGAIGDPRGSRRRAGPAS